MSKTTTFAATLGIAICALTSAQAQSWDGAYATLGVSIQDLDFGDDSLLGTPETESAGDDFGVYVGAGYDVQYNQFVFGVMADVEGFSSSKLVTSGKDSYDLDADWFATARARAGYLVNDDTMIYGSAGLAWLDTAYANESFFFFSEEGSERLSGHALGIGLERRLSNGLTLRADYVHAEFEESDAFSGSGFEPTIEPIVQSLRLGVVARF